MTFDFHSFVKDGRIRREVAESIAAVIRKLEGKQVKITVKELKRTRSNPQNAFFHGVVLIKVWEWMVEQGNDVSLEEAKVFLKEHVGKIFKLVLIDGRRIPVLRSTRDLTTVEWEDWMEKIRAWAAPYGLIIPFPNKQLTSEDKCQEA